MQTMTKKQWKREQGFRAAATVAKIADVSVHDALMLLDTLRRYERKLQRLAEIECNGYPKLVIESRDGKTYRYNVEDATLRAKCEKSETNYTRMVKQLAKANNLEVDFQGDPRGLMFRLTYKGQEINYSVGA